MRILTFLAFGLLLLPWGFVSCTTKNEVVNLPPRERPVTRVVTRTTTQNVAVKKNRTGPSPYQMEVVNSYDPQER